MTLTKAFLEGLGWKQKGDVMFSPSTPDTPMLGWANDILYINGHPLPFVVNTTGQIIHLYSLINPTNERNTTTNTKKQGAKL